MPSVKLVEKSFAGQSRHYFANQEIQVAFEIASGKHVVTPDWAIFLRLIGVEVETEG